MKRLWAALLAAPLLSGCLTAPETTPQVKEIAPAALGLGAQAAPQPASDWWKAFGDPQADRLAARLMADNPTLAAALARIRGAQADLSAARADSYPQVSLDGAALTLCRLAAVTLAGAQRIQNQVALGLAESVGQ